jgi:DNA mismatch endonuclease (patch repair protein)
MGLRFRVDVATLAGRPDIVFPRHRVVVFCDGEFWHGRDLEARLAKLRTGHNAPYWVAKIRANVERDRKRTAELTARGWHVLRFWESDIARSPMTIAMKIAAQLQRIDQAARR